jgi:H+/Cl- antiporter ClcA
MLHAQIPGSLPSKDRSTSVWYDELQTVEAAGDARFHRYRRPLFEKSKKPHFFTPDERKRMDQYESIDYHEPQSLVYKEYLARKKHSRRWLKWLIFMAIGVAVGLWACAMMQTLDYLAYLKLNTVQDAISRKNQEVGAGLSQTVSGISYAAFWEGYSIYIAWSMVTAFLSSVVCLAVPTAAGSGVPDVMAYLNGIMFPKIFNLRNLVTKSISCILAVNSGLSVGAEGPLIHIGSLIGAGLPTGRSRTLRCSASEGVAQFRNPQDHRDFISAGAACGVTAAFSSPIGGLLFIMEEVATVFPTKLAWMVFLSCLTAMLPIELINTFVMGWRTNPLNTGGGNIAENAIALFEVHRSDAVPVNLTTIVPTVILATYMGFLAVAFTVGNIKIVRWRAKRITPNVILRVLEPPLCALFFVTLNFCVPLAFDCEPIPKHFKPERDDTILFTAFCQDSNEFHPLATLTLTNSYNAIRLLFTQKTDQMFPWHALLVYHLLYTAGAMVAGGMFMSSGIIIPTIVMGASGGRLAGVIFNRSWSDAGLMSLIGAAAYFGGLSRLTFSLVVIMMEITNDLTHLPWIMLAVVVAKSIGDRYCHSLYHALLEVKCVPFLEVQTNVHKFDTFSAMDIMTKDVVTISRKQSMTELVTLLQGNKHHGYPVVTREGKYIGMLSRAQISLILWHIYFLEIEGKTTSKMLKEDPADERTRRCSFFDQRFPSYEELQYVQQLIFWNRLDEIPQTHDISDDTMNAVINLTPFIDIGAFYVREGMSLSKTYYIFRNMGLRHLPVLDRKMRVAGIITRTNLVGDRMHERMNDVAARVTAAAKEARALTAERRKKNIDTPS